MISTLSAVISVEDATGLVKDTHVIGAETQLAVCNMLRRDCGVTWWSLQLDKGFGVRGDNIRLGNGDSRRHAF